jgi:hypothetical protein
LCDDRAVAGVVQVQACPRMCRSPATFLDASMHAAHCVRRALVQAAWRPRRHASSSALVQQIAGELAPTQPSFGMAARDVRFLSQPSEFYAKLLVRAYIHGLPYLFTRYL